MRILVVEDDQIIREGISEYLSEFGYDIVQAKDGQTEFVYGSMFLFVEQYGVEAPFYVFFIASADKGQLGAP